MINIHENSYVFFFSGMNFSSFLGFLCRHKTAEAVLILLQLFLPLGLLAFLHLEQESVSVSLEPESSSLELAWVSGEWSCSSPPLDLLFTRKFLNCFVHSCVQVLAVL